MDDGRTSLVVCCYMPNDDMNGTADWNSDVSRNTTQSEYLAAIYGVYTYKLNVHGNIVTVLKKTLVMVFNEHKRSCFEYLLLSERLYNDIVLSVVVWPGINLSLHQPVLLTVTARCASRSEENKDTEESGKRMPGLYQ